MMICFTEPPDGNSEDDLAVQQVNNLDLLTDDYDFTCGPYASATGGLWDGTYSNSSLTGQSHISQRDLTAVHNGGAQLLGPVAPQNDNYPFVSGGFAALVPSSQTLQNDPFRFEVGSGNRDASGAVVPYIATLACTQQVPTTAPVSSSQAQENDPFRCEVGLVNGDAGGVVAPYIPPSVGTQQVPTVFSGSYKFDTCTYHSFMESIAQPLSTTLPRSLHLPFSNEFLMSASNVEHRPTSPTAERRPLAPRFNPPKIGPIIMTSARSFDEFVAQYPKLDKSKATYSSNCRRRTSTSYYSWADSRDFSVEIVGYAGGGQFETYRMCYSDGTEESLKDILKNHLGWNIGTFKVATKDFEDAENLPQLYDWNPQTISNYADIPPAAPGETVVLDKNNAFQVWKGMVFLFRQPGFFLYGKEPAKNILASPEEQLAAQISQKAIHHNLKEIRQNLVDRYL
ncbi:hypothetical protein EV359DRAFT_67276 [Lentinula novae-zelandiae]|nr:hypothetical protein EV359DRAFT_67276 [Lentinula novae-zelandiae]